MNDENKAVTNGRAKQPKTTDGDVQETRAPQVFALACPKSEHHKNVRVYRTVGPTRYCVCDDCGHTWKKIGPPAGKELAQA